MFLNLNPADNRVTGFPPWTSVSELTPVYQNLQKLLTVSLTRGYYKSFTTTVSEIRPWNGLNPPFSFAALNASKQTVQNQVGWCYIWCPPRYSGLSLFVHHLYKLHSLNSKIKLFADDAVMYREILSSQDEVIFQNDIDSITEWAKPWQMSLNLDMRCQKNP